MEVLGIVEHEDGSATYNFDLTPQEHEAMCRNGILWAIIAGVTGITQDKVIADYLAQNSAPEEETKMPEQRRYWHTWVCEETDDSYEFDIVVVSEKDSYWEPGYEDITESEYQINYQEVTYREFVERTGWNQADMSDERYRIDL